MTNRHLLTVPNRRATLIDVRAIANSALLPTTITPATTCMLISRIFLLMNRDILIFSGDFDMC